jgi:signal transduction histidine kinase/ligand-binding sensor domain-containing protein
LVRAVLLLIFLLPLLPLSAQPADLKFDHIGLEHGLSQSTVYAVTQDAQGFIWFGTQDGLNRYDGYSIKIFKNDPSDSNSLSDNTIRCLLGDSNGDLWIGTLHGGLNKYVVSENKFYHFKHDKNDSSSIGENNITALFKDSNKNLWIGTQSRGLYKYSSGRFTRFLSDKNNSSSLSSNTVWSIKEDNNKNICIATGNGLSVLPSGISENSFPRFNNYYIDRENPARNNILSLSSGKDGNFFAGTAAGLYIFNINSKSFSGLMGNSKIPPPVSMGLIRSVYDDPSGNIWIAAHDAGLYKYEKSSGAYQLYAPFSLRIIYGDRSGILWMGTSADGVKIYDRRRNQFRHYYPNRDDLKNNIVFTLLEDSDGELWTGVYNSGLFRYNKQRDVISSYKFNPDTRNGLNSNIILTLYQGRDNKIWIGTAGGGLNCLDKKTDRFTSYMNKPGDVNSISSNIISAIYEDKSGNLWIGNLEGGLDYFIRSENKFVHYFLDEKKSYLTSGKGIIAIYEGRRTGLWIGINNGGIYQYIPQENTFRSYRISPLTDTLTNTNTALCFYEDESGKVWMGTYGSGLCNYDPVNKTFRYYTTKDGLSNDVVYGILPDRSANLWLSTNNGISKFNPAAGSFKNYDMKDGLQSNEFNQGAYTAGHSGEFFFGGINGFSAFFPDEIIENQYIPPVYLSSFKIFDTMLPLPSPVQENTEIELSYSQNFFSFEFVALNYTLPERNMYAYKLEGFDSDWHRLSASQRYGSYSNLDPGTYTLLIKGSNNDGVWNETGSSVKIIITPPFWMRWWFRLLIVLLFTGAVTAVIMQRVSSLHKRRKLQEEVSRRLIEKEEKERKRIAGELHDSIGQELIVIKNRAQIGCSNEKEAAAQLQQISDIASSALQTVRNIAYNLRPYELDRIGLSKALKGMIRRISETTSIAFTADIDDIDKIFSAEEGIKIFRIVQEFLNNSLKHSCATEIIISIKRNQEDVFIRLYDNGKGFIPGELSGLSSETGGSGLPGILERIRILGGIHKMDSAPGKGTELTLRIPLSKTESVQ